MAKTKLNITLDRDLIEFSKLYATEQRTTVSELISQFLLNLKRTKSQDPTEIIISDPEFSFNDSASVEITFEGNSAT